jgi:hypothetical protein
MQCTWFEMKLAMDEAGHILAVIVHKTDQKSVLLQIWGDYTRRDVKFVPVILSPIMRT